MKTGTIYMLVFPDGEGYIGQTTRTLKDRFKNGKGYNPETPIGKAIEKHGWHNVKVEVLYRDIPIKELRRYESLCITRYGTYHNGLNCDIGKDHFSCETRSKISESQRQRVADGTHHLLGGEINRQRIADGTHNFLDGEISRQTQRQRVADGTHHFLGGEIQRQRVADGTHHFLGGEIQRQAQRQRVADGTHNLLGGKINRERVENGTHHLLGGEIQRQRVADGTHHFLGGEIQRQRVADGTHHFLGRNSTLLSNHSKEKVKIVYLYTVMIPKTYWEGLNAVHRRRKLEREGFFDKALPDVSNASQEALF